MKKNVKKLLMALLSLVLAMGLTILVLWTLSVWIPETQKLDITQFSGRIIPADNIKPGTFTIKVPMSEALKYGKDAILSYGEQGVKIWKPDSLTSGVFLYSDLATDNVSLWVYDVSLADKEITLHRSARVFAYFATLFFLLVAIGINIFVTKATIKRFRS